MSIESIYKMSEGDRKLDVIVYGATGYTGKLVCSHFKNQYLDRDSSSEETLRIGIGGRSKEKLEKVKSELDLPSSLPIYVVDSFDADGLANMCKETKAVITLVGPYALYGDALIRSCAEQGTHYFDLTGEPLWVSEQISKLSKIAQESKSIIIPSCGWDSVPSDLNTMIASSKLKEIMGEDSSVGRVTSGVKLKSGSASFGTFSSLIGMFDGGIPALRKIMDYYLLSPVEGVQRRTGDWITRENSIVGGFFVMAPHNGAMVRRTWGLLESTGENTPNRTRYGPHFTYEEYLITPGVITAFMLTLVSRIFVILFLIPQMRNLVKRFGPKSGDGPTEKERETGWFKLITIAHSTNDDVQVSVTMSGNKDPGYGWTSMCVAECAVTVIKSYDQLPPHAKSGGILTPVTGMGDALLRRLQSGKIIELETRVLKDERKKTN
ncbi:Saccharopine dehydrogenase-domain-containing protein [Melampsora americana]|nr:Saccharopine dehydrogenase-domain-containing protein [Melampsora americana]